jgi:hypothetical protein
MTSNPALCAFALNTTARPFSFVYYSSAARGGPIGTKVVFDVFNPETKENKTVELTRQKFVTSTE